MTPAMDDFVLTEFDHIDRKIAGARNDLFGLNTKIDSFGDHLAEEMKNSVLAAQHPKDAHSPDVVPQNYV